MGKSKTLGDYIDYGRHEFLAFVKTINSEDSSNHCTLGNRLGNIHLGLLVCDREVELKRDKSNDKAKFFYKEKFILKEDANIVFGDFDYSAKVISEVPLSLEIPYFFNSKYLKRGSKEFIEALNLLRKYDLF